MADPDVLVNASDLQSYVTDLFSLVGMPDDDAMFCAASLVQTNLWGIDSHGVLRVPIYVRRLRNGAINARPHIQTVHGSGALEVLDGDDGAGFVVGRAAMQRAMALAAEYNVGMVGVARSNHFGAAGLYARLAAERGMIGIAMTNVVPNIVAPGGSKPITGNNPLAIAIPTYDQFPFVLDMSMSAVAGGKLLLAMEKGEKIPLDWATDREGRPTDDPAVGFAGFLLPMGGFKGLGLSYVVDILCGLITGGVFGYAMKGMYTHPEDPSLTGHMMLAINVDAVMDRETMRARMAQFCQTVKASPMWNPQGEMFVPGEIEYRTAQRRLAEGLPLPRKLYDDLAALGVELGLSNRLSIAPNA